MNFFQYMMIFLQILKGDKMAKKIIAVNAGPRKGWNTDTLIDEAIKGAESAGAEVQKFNLFRLEKYTGCISCFGCKKINIKEIAYSKTV